MNFIFNAVCVISLHIFCIGGKHPLNKSQIKRFNKHFLECLMTSFNIHFNNCNPKNIKFNLSKSSIKQQLSISSIINIRIPSLNKIRKPVQKLKNKFYFKSNKMGQNICSSTSTINTDMGNNYLEFQFGQDQKETKIQHQENIKFQEYNDLQNLLESCMDKLKISKLMYKDPTMPNDKIVLKSIAKQNSQKKQIQAVFMRPYKFLDNMERGRPYKIFLNEDSTQDYILVNDQVMQYFGVFLCFLAKNPKIIENLILTEANSYGILAVKMNINGKPTIIYLDDYILCSQNRPLFSQPIKNMFMWPNILQKAWLKTTGFTQKIIEKSTPQQVFQSFLDHPYKKFSLQQLSEHDIKKQISKYLYNQDMQYGYILTTKKDPKIHIGISGRKYLYLIGSFVFENKRLFYIRNPCGKFGFRGTYDEISEQIRNKIKILFNCYVQEGNFLLDQSQFIEQISGFAICYYSKSMKSTNQVVQLENNSEIFIQTQMKNPGNLSLCFRQQSSKKSEAKLSPITYQIFNMTTGQLVSDQQNNEGCFGLHNAYLFPQVIKKLPQSKYLIRIKKKDKKRHYFGIQSTLIACCANEMKFDIKNQLQFSEHFKTFLKKQGKRTLQKQMKSNSAGKRGINPIQNVVFEVGDIICVYIQYVSPKTQQFKIQISFPQLKNLELIYPEINLKQTSVLPKTLGPHNKQEIIVFQKEDLTAQTQLGFFELEAF